MKGGFRSLNEILSFRGGGTPRKDVPEYWSDEIPWASVKDFKSLDLAKTQDSISRKGLEASASNLIPAGHVIIPTRMALGKAAINSIDMAINQDLRALIPKVPLDSRYLLHAMIGLADEIVRYGSGATVKGITQENLGKLQIPLPPLAEQKRIAAILDAADALRAKRSEALAQLDALLQSTFLTLFGDPVTNPMGWPMAAMGSQLKVIGGYAFKSDDFQERGLPVIRISNLNKDSIDLDGCARIPKAKIGKGEKFRIIAGDTLIAMSGATTGKLGLVPDDLNDEWYLNQRVGAFRIPGNSRIHREYLRALLASPFYQRHVLNLAGGAAQPNISGAQLESAKTPLPPLPLQQKFAAIVESIERQKTTQRTHLTELDALFAALQHRAFRGEL